MKRITNPTQVAELGTVMGIWAHPDDETFFTGGLMAAAAQNGQTVACVTATKGEAGSRDEKKWPSAMIGDVRAAELSEALKLIGVKCQHWLGYKDGCCQDLDDDEAVGRLLPLLERYRPDTVITFPPDGVFGHLDHISVSRWSLKACVQLSAKPANIYYCVDTQERYDRYTRPLDTEFNLYYNVDQPFLVPEAECDLIFRMPLNLARLKCQMLKAMPSQMEAILAAFGHEYMERALSTEAFVRADRDLAWARPKKL